MYLRTPAGGVSHLNIHRLSFGTSHKKADSRNSQEDHLPTAWSQVEFHRLQESMEGRLIEEMPCTTGSSWVSWLSGHSRCTGEILYHMLRLKPRPAKLPRAGIRITWAHPGVPCSASGTELRNLHFEQFSVHADAAGPGTQLNYSCF